MFKFLTITLLLFALTGAQPPKPSPNGILDTIIEQMIDKIKEIIPYEIFVAGWTVKIPENSHLNGLISTNDTNLTGLASFDATVDTTLSSFELGLTWPLITGSSGWLIDLILNSKEFECDAYFNATIVDLDVDVSANVDLLLPPYVSDVHVVIGLGNLTVYVNKILCDPDLGQSFTDYINTHGAEFINGHKDIISGIIDYIINAIINAIFEPVS